MGLYSIRETSKTMSARYSFSKFQTCMCFSCKKKKFFLRKEKKKVNCNTASLSLKSLTYFLRPNILPVLLISNEINSQDFSVFCFLGCDLHANEFPYFNWSREFS